jgi:hypothetical protein
MQFNADQQKRALTLLETMAWEDMDVSIHEVEAALRLALEATEDDFRRWGADTVDRLEQGRYDEFSLPTEVVAGLPCEDRLAYVARLLQSLALSYGVDGYGASPVNEASEGTPAALLRGLNDITLTPITRANPTERPMEGDEPCVA